MNSHAGSKPSFVAAILGATLVFMFVFPFTFAASGYFRALLPADSRAADLTVIPLGFILAALVPYWLAARTYDRIARRRRLAANERRVRGGRWRAVAPFITFLALWVPAVVAGGRVMTWLMPPVRKALGPGTTAATIVALFLMGIVTLPVAFVPAMLVYHWLAPRSEASSAPPSAR